MEVQRVAFTRAPIYAELLPLLHVWYLRRVLAMTMTKTTGQISSLNYFDVLYLFPLKSQLCKTPFLSQWFFAWLFQINFLPTQLLLALSLVETALCHWCMGRLAKANSWWCHCKATLGGPLCWFSLCWEGGVKRKKEWHREAKNCLHQAA